MRPKVCINVLEMLYNKTKNINSNIDSILSIDRQINKMVKSDIRAVFALLCQLYIKQLGIVITSYIVYIQRYTIKRVENITI